MAKELLHKSKLELFKKWLSKNNIEFKEVTFLYQVLQIKQGGMWLSIYDKFTPEHFTNDKRLNSLIRRFIKESH